MAYRILKTCAITLVYCLIWMGLELTLYGEIQERIVDDIMMLLFIPVIWKAVESINIVGELRNLYYSIQAFVWRFTCRGYRHGRCHGCEDFGCWKMKKCK